MDTARNENSSYGVAMSLRVWHPSVLGAEMTNAIGLSPSLSNDVGAGRRTPTGQILDGVYTQTYWLYKFSFPKKTEIEDCIAKALAVLSHKSDFFSRICSTGGRCELFIGIFLEKNAGIMLDRNLIRQVADLGLALSFDVFLPDNLGKSAV
jgi:hypothetical protein